MLKLASIVVSAAALAVVPSLSPADAVQDPQEMAAMMAKMKEVTSPGPMHEKLARFVGDWDTELRVFMGDQASPPSKGRSSFTWLMEGRWLQSRGTGSMMGMPVESFMLIGYDNFKKSYVTTSVTSMDTAMLHAEGDLTRDEKALICYGTLDEYLTGEHDKMVRYVWRFVSDDEIVQEVHDLPIGETGTKVVEVRFTRRR